MILVVDAGNTRVKWGVYDNGWQAQGSLRHDELHRLAPALQAYAGLGQAVISSVAGAVVDAGLQAQLDSLGIAARCIKAQASACGVTNGYANPAQLGSDRWAAAVAAWQRTHAACVVASAGTALTVDALSSRGEFLGGLIVPGLTMMKQALAANTAGGLAVEGELRDFPAATGDAVHSGALRAMAGAVEQMLARLAQREMVPVKLLLAGGDAGALQSALSGAGEIVDNLVLEGLILIAKECAQ